MLKNELTKLLNIKYPIIQAPMAGGITTTELVTAVSGAGGLGMIGAGYMTPDQIRTQAAKIRKSVSGTFGINLFVPSEFELIENEIKTADELLKPVREKLHASESSHLELPDFKKSVSIFHEQVKAVMNEKIPVCSFTFGIPTSEVIQQLKKQGIVVIGTATTVKEAIEIEKSGMDAVAVQGSEAGGHRGNFLAGKQESMVGLMSLIPQVADKVSIPVIAAGGIMDGRGLMASICLGAQAVQMGTAFLTCAESGANEVHKEAVLNAQEDQVVLTRAFSGKWARGIHNGFMKEMQGNEDRFPEFPVQNTLTKEIRKAAASQKNPEYMSLWSGQSPRLAKKQTAASLIKEIMTHAETLLK